MRRKQAFELVRQANPMVEGSSGPGGFLSQAALLEQIDERSGDMQTQEKPITEKSPKEPHRRRNIALALGAAVVVAAVGASIWLVGDGTSDAASRQATVEGYYAASNSHDIAAVMEFFSEESEIVGHPADRPATRGTDLRGLAAIRSTLELQFEAIALPFMISNVEVSGNTVTWDSEHDAVSLGVRVCANGHSAIVEGGKILFWTHAALHSCPS